MKRVCAHCQTEIPSPSPYSIYAYGKFFCRALCKNRFLTDQIHERIVSGYHTPWMQEMKPRCEGCGD
jgi:hypothetical protein